MKYTLTVFFSLLVSALLAMALNKSTVKNNEFKFFDGNKIISCFHSTRKNCGYELKQCTNGVEYLCLNNIRRIK